MSIGEFLIKKKPDVVSAGQRYGFLSQTSYASDDSATVMPNVLRMEAGSCPGR